jgi:Glutathione S-transferase N-terminal domain
MSPPWRTRLSQRGWACQVDQHRSTVNHLQIQNPMITLFSYPELFGVADNNGYGLKVFAFLRLNGMAFRHEHVFDASAAPRGQLPYIVDGGKTVGDSETIIAHVIAKYRLTIDAALTAAQRDMSHLITRMLDDLYWVMSYSRWKDEQFWPAFRDALLRQHPSLTEAGLGSLGLQIGLQTFWRGHNQRPGHHLLAPCIAYGMITAARIGWRAFR